MSNQRKTPTLEITGPVKAVGSLTNRNGFESRKVWLNFDDSYEHNGEHREKFNTPEFEVSGRALEHLDGINPGDEVKISYNPIGFKWKNKEGKDIIIGSNRAWKVEKIQREVLAVPQEVREAVAVEDLNGSDDLPF